MTHTVIHSWHSLWHTQWHSVFIGEICYGMDILHGNVNIARRRRLSCNINGLSCNIHSIAYLAEKNTNLILPLLFFRVCMVRCTTVEDAWLNLRGYIVKCCTEISWFLCNNDVKWTIIYIIKFYDQLKWNIFMLENPPLFPPKFPGISMYIKIQTVWCNQRISPWLQSCVQHLPESIQICVKNHHRVFKYHRGSTT